jgi:hypothetical protein
MNCSSRRQETVIGRCSHMTSRERIVAAINYQPVDRVPIDFGGTRQSGISVWAYERLCERLGVNQSKPVRVFDRRKSRLKRVEI